MTVRTSVRTHDTQPAKCNVVLKQLDVASAADADA